MAYRATVYRVMIASPSDVVEERRVIRKVLDEWNAANSEEREQVLLPVSWETHSAPLMGERAQDVINRQVVAQSDLLVAIFWTRLGTPTGSAASGTVEEIERHLEKGKPVMVYFSSQATNLDDIDLDQVEAVREFRDECLERGLIGSYSTLEQFEEGFRTQLPVIVAEAFPSTADAGIGAGGLEAEAQGRGPAVSDVVAAIRELLEAVPDESETGPQLTTEARGLLLEAAQDKNGSILKIRTFGGLTIQTHGVDLVADKANPRATARWEAALGELEAAGLIQRRSEHSFAVTAEGFEVADTLGPWHEARGT